MVQPGLPELCSSAGSFPSTKLYEVKNRLAVVRAREADSLEGDLMLLLYVGEKLWAYTMKHFLGESSARINTILAQLSSGPETESVRELANRLADFSPTPSFNMEILLYVDAANVWKTADATFGPGATEAPLVSHLLLMERRKLGLLKVKKLSSMFWSIPGTDIRLRRGASPLGGAQREIRRDFTVPIVAYSGSAQTGQHAAKEYWTTSVTVTLDSKAAENLYEELLAKAGLAGEGTAPRTVLLAFGRLRTETVAQCNVMTQRNACRACPCATGTGT